MKTPHYKAKYSRSTSRGWHKALSLVLLLTILAGSFPAGGFTALADEVSDADSMIQQEGAQAEGEGAQLLQAPAPDEAAPESIPYESGTDQSGTDESGTDESGTVQPEADQSGTDQLEADESGTDQSGTDQSGTDQSGTVSQSEQPTEEPAAEPAEEPAGPAAEPTAEPAEAQDEPDEIPAEEETVYANSVSGALWLDILEDENSGAQHGDGIRQAGEEPVPDYDVSLYKADDKDTAVQTVKTDSDGQYIFENIEPGTYVVGISTCEKDGVEYLLPIAGITDDNLFADYNEEHTAVYTAPIAVETDTAAAGQNAGLRTPPDVQPRTGSYVVTRDSDGANLGTFTSLQDAVNACPIQPGDVECTITAMADDPAMGSAVTIPVGKIITLTSASPNAIRTITQTMSERHIQTSGSRLTLENIILAGEGRTPTSSNLGPNGGIEQSGGGRIVMGNGSKITKCSAQYGGGVYIGTGATPALTMNGNAVISDNKAFSRGGGVFLANHPNAHLVMNGGKITGNFVGDTIYSNFGEGGGVFKGEMATLTMNAGEISGNRAKNLLRGNHGGGICAMDGAQVSPADPSTSYYKNLTISSSAIVSGNTADTGAELPPSNYLDFSDPSIRGTATFDGSLLDNDNISYRNPGYAIVYNVNNATSTPDRSHMARPLFAINLLTQAQAGFNVPGAIEPGKEKFIGWNTQADGNGTPYNPGQSITVTEDTTLYAQWDHYRYIVSKDSDSSIIGSYDKLADATNACPVNVPCTITATADDTAMGNMVTIPSGKSITLTSASSNAIRSITQTLSTRHLDVIGKLTLKNIVLKGVGKQTDSSGTVNGGIAVSTGGQLRMEAGAEITKCYTNVTSGAGGAGVNVNGGAFTMTGGKITNNVTPNDGGGVYMLSSTAFVMSGGEISGNKAARGGGVYLFGNGFFIKNGGDITGNTATGHGGGVAMAQGTFISNSGNISGNHANGNGGGVYMSIAQGTFTMGGGTLSGNTAGGDGGAVYTPDYDYDNPADTSKYSRISVSASAVISGNTASGGVFAPPVNHQAFSTRAVKPFPGTLLDNNNINYRGNKYAIAYRVNNTTNTPDAYQATNIATGSSGTATLYTQTQAGFNAASAIEPGKEKFIGWNTQADGNGTPYTPGQTNVPVNGNLTLYAQWDHYRYIVTNDTSNDCLGSYDQLSAAVNACLTTDPCTITATSDDTSVNVVVTIPANKQITLTSDGTRHTVTQSSLHALGRHFEVNGSLTLKSIILMGRGLTSGGPISVVNGGIQVNNGGTLMMENDAQITQCFAANRGGGVLLDDGTFTMNGGEISGNVADSIGGGVFALGNAVFNLNDGEISENTSWGNGAGVMLLDTGVRFTMTGGEISGNTSGANGGGVIALRDALFTMSGGKITGNTASKSGGGVSATNFVMVDGEISGNTATDYGGGVYSTGTFTMHDGVITDNEAVKGGGVYGSNNTFAFTMLDGKIYENTATGTNSSDGGGGVGMTNGSFTMKGGEITGNTVASGLMSLGRGGGVCTDGSNAALKLEAGEISGNTAPYGGGVAIVGINATFTMTNGEITGNHANGNWVDTGDGGGVLVAKPSNLVMQGGEISGNTSTGEGGGVHTMSYSYSNPAATTGNNSYENISIASAATVSGNTAGERFSPPSNYPQFTNRATNSFNGLLLDNDNINYRNPNYAVTYDANNSTNTPDAIQATNINTGNSGNVILYTQTQAGFNAASAIEPGKEVFLGWNTQVDGNGTHYDVGQTITISGNLTLFAEWDHYRYIVSKDSDSSVIGSYDKLDDAVNACPVSVPCTITATSDDPTQSGGTTANMVMRQVITLTSDNTTRTIKQPGGAHIVLSKRGTLTLKNIILEGPGIDGGTSPTRRGGVTTGGTLTDPGGTLIMDAGSVITKCFADKGGGVHIGHGGSFTMNGDAKIVNNIAGYGGGGVYLNTSMGDNPFTMNDNATISDNVSNRGGGGGVHVLRSSMTMNGGKITGNTSRAVEGSIAGQGGGVYFDAGSGYSFMMYAGEISDNRSMASSQQNDTARGSGGGIYYYFPPYPDGNPVTNVANCYAVMHISSNATVEHNTADLGSAFPPNNYLDFNDPAIRGVYTFDGRLLDNDNINYRNPNYMVTYDANNGGIGDLQKYYQNTNVSTGTTTVNALSIGSEFWQADFTAPANHVFVGWTENSNGTGTLYRAGDPITLTGSKTLYAKWVPFVDVTLSKTVTGAMGDKTRGFTFKITFEDSTGTKLPSGTQLDYTGSVLSGTTGVTAPASGTLTLDNTGSDTITLKHGQSIKIEDVQVNYKIIIEETDGTGYTVKYTDSANPSSPQTSATTGPKTLSGDRTFAFENNRGGSTPGGFDLNSTGLALLIGIGVILIGGGLFIKRVSRRAYKERH